MNKAKSQGREQMLKYRSWTPEEDARLIELRASGRSAISIAAALKRTTKSVERRLSNLRTREREVSSDPDPQP
jgi:hypothetical protein